MVKRESRAAEYLRRMRALGYKPSLMVMDDEDMNGAGIAEIRLLPYC